MPKCCNLQLKSSRESKFRAMLAFGVACAGLLSGRTMVRADERSIEEPAASADALGLLLPEPHIINAHEHLMGPKQLDKYLRACSRVGIDSTVFVGSSRYTMYAGTAAFIEHHDNNKYLCELATSDPRKFMAWVTFQPEQDDMVKMLAQYLAHGATGVKLYVGHGEKTGDGLPFHCMPLDDPRLCVLYDFCQAHRVPILMHVNAGKFLPELERVLDRYPEVPWIIPHFLMLGSKLDSLAPLMRKYPTVMTDLSFGVLDYQFSGLRRISQEAVKYREFFIEFQDRIVFGTDAVITGASYKTDDFLSECFLAYRQMLELPQYSIDIQGKGDNRKQATFNGLALPTGVVCKIYHENFESLLQRSSIRGGRIELSATTP